MTGWNVSVLLGKGYKQFLTIFASGAQGSVRGLNSRANHNSMPKGKCVGLGNKGGRAGKC